MSALVVGLDPSPLRLGWGAVTLDDGAAVACGMERLDLPGMGWSDDQAREALRVVDERLTRLGHTVAAVYIEQPALVHQKASFDAGRAVQEVLVAARRRWPHADGPHFLQPSEWKALAEVPANPRGLRNVALVGYVLHKLEEEGRQGAVEAIVASTLKPSELKPWVYALAVEAGFAPGDSQDAADAALVALAGQRRNAETWDRAVERGAA